jgi:predicted PurR-regulated permease PerM
MNISPGRHRQDRGSDHEHVDKISTPTTIFILLVAAVALHAIQLIILPFVISGLLAYLCTPILEWSKAHTRIPRAFFAVVAFLFFLAIVASMALWIVPPAAREFTRLATGLQDIVEGMVRSAFGDQTVSWFGEPMNATQMAQTIVAALHDFIARPGAMAILGGAAFAGIFGLSLTLVLLFYFLLSGPQMFRGLLRLVPPKQRPLIEHITLQVDPVLKRYFIGVVVVVIYASAAAYVGLGLVLGIRHAVLLALLTGVLEMIPMIGPGLSAVIAGLVAIRYAAGLGPIIAYAIYATALRLSIDQLIGPLALGTAARISPVLIIFCFLAGGTLFGIAGVILAVPVALITKTTLSILYDETLPPAPTST